MTTESEKILQNNYSGSEELLDLLIEHLKKLTGTIEEARFLEIAQDKFRHFQTLITFLNKFSQIPAVERINFLEVYEAGRKSGNTRLLNNVVAHLSRFNNFLTLSNSKSVYSTLLRLAEGNKNLRVVVSESRPQLEGRILSENLVKAGITTSLVTEAQLPVNIAKTDVLLLGADKILANDDVINKTGSLAASIIAKYYNVPVYVIASKTKYSTEFNHIEDTANPQEIYPGNNLHISVNNNYFELIPKSLITQIITD